MTGGWARGGCWWGAKISLSSATRLLASVSATARTDRVSRTHSHYLRCNFRTVHAICLKHKPLRADLFSAEMVHTWDVTLYCIKTCIKRKTSRLLLLETDSRNGCRNTRAASDECEVKLNWSNVLTLNLIKRVQLRRHTSKNKRGVTDMHTQR